MKNKLTRKNINTRYAIEVGYCEAQWLLSDINATGYNAGVYGWNWDAYNVNGYTVVTGYRNFPAGMRKSRYVNEYDGKAREALDNRDYAALEEIRNAWINKELNEWKEKEK